MGFFVWNEERRECREANQEGLTNHKIQYHIYKWNAREKWGVGEDMEGAWNWVGGAVGGGSLIRRLFLDFRLEHNSLDDFANFADPFAWRSVRLKFEVRV